MLADSEQQFDSVVQLLFSICNQLHGIICAHTFDSDLEAFCSNRPGAQNCEPGVSLAIVAERHVVLRSNWFDASVTFLLSQAEH